MTEPANKSTPGMGPAHGRRNLLLITLLFLAPVVLGTTLYFTGWRPQGRALHHGELVQPARPLSDITLRKTDGSESRLGSLNGSWVMVTFSHLPCEAACRNNLYKMQQVRLTQGKDARRVRRVFIVPSASGDPAAFETQYPGMQVFSVAPLELQKAAREFAGDEKSFNESERVYLIDPLGNLVMRYGADADPSGMRKDLARLLRLSQIG